MSPMSTSYASRPCVDPALLARECRDRGIPTESWFGRANSFAVPLGKGPGTGHVLLKKEDLDAIPRTADQRLAFLDDVGNRETLQKIVLVEATCVTPGAESDPQAVYLCELRDRRHHLARVPIDKAYNVRAADGGSRLAQTLNSGSAWTWQGVVDNIVTAIGLSTSYFVLPFTPDATPENLTYYGGWAWDALCDVLDRIACEVKYDPVLDTFSVVRLGDTDTAATAELAALAGDRTWDAYASDNSRAWRPEKVRVRFPRRPLPTDGSSPVYTVDVTLTATTGVVSGTYVQLDDDLAALAATGSPSNAAACSTRAAERAADWLRKRQGYDRRLLKVYRDFRPTARTKLLGKTLAEYGIDDRGGAIRTEIRSAPDYSLENWHPLRGFALPPTSTTITGGFWVARLTTQDGSSPFGWKYYKRKINTSGVEADDGAESAGFTAFPHTIDGIDTCNPVTGLRVLMWDSVSAGKQEFLPIGMTDSSHPGLVSLAAQEMGSGWKKFNADRACADEVFTVYADYEDSLVGALHVDQNTSGPPSVSVFEQDKPGFSIGLYGIYNLWDTRDPTANDDGTITFTLYEKVGDTDGDIVFSRDSATSTRLAVGPVYMFAPDTGNILYLGPSGVQLAGQTFNALSGSVGYYYGGVAGLDGVTVARQVYTGGLATSLGTKPTVTGSRGGNAALASLLTALAGGVLDLITDSTT